MPFVSAVSEHPVVTAAVGEVVGRALEVLGPAPDLAVLFVGGAATGAIEDVVGTVRSLLRPVVLVGCTASGVIADTVETGAGGIALFAGVGFDATASVDVDDHAAFVLADPFTHQAGDTPTCFASAARGPGGNRLLLDDAILDEGVVSVTLDGVETVDRRSRMLDLVELPALAADGALLFAGEDEPIVPIERLGGAALGGMRTAHRDRQRSTLVLFRHR